MNVLRAIETRRSIRSFKGEQVDRELLKEILKAAMYAPSARNQQPWHFIVIDDKDILRKVPDIHPYSTMVPSAQLAILICADPNLEKSKGYWPVDCAAATQNLLLAAHGMGLGAVWLGVYPREERMKGCSDLFKIPSHVKPFALVPIGYPENIPSQPDRFKKERVHVNAW